MAANAYASPSPVPTQHSPPHPSILSVADPAASSSSSGAQQGVESVHGHADVLLRTAKTRLQAQREADSALSGEIKLLRSSGSLSLLKQQQQGGGGGGLGRGAGGQGDSTSALRASLARVQKMSNALVNVATGSGGAAAAVAEGAEPLQGGGAAVRVGGLGDIDEEVAQDWRGEEGEGGASPFKGREPFDFGCAFVSSANLPVNPFRSPS